jgi:hypothetical protein
MIPRKWRQRMLESIELAAKRNCTNQATSKPSKSFACLEKSAIRRLQQRLAGAHAFARGTLFVAGVTDQ